MRLANLFGKQRSRVLALFFANPEQDFSIAEVARKLRIPHSTARGWLATLNTARVLSKQKRGNLTLFQLDQECSVFSALREIVEFSDSGQPVGRRLFEKIPQENVGLKEVEKSLKSKAKKVQRTIFSLPHNLKSNR